MVVTAQITAGELIPRNRLRKSLFIQNNDATNNVFIKRERTPNTTVTTSNYDFRLSPGAGISLNDLLDGAEAIQDRYTVIATTAPVQLGIFETEDIVR